VAATYTRGMRVSMGAVVALVAAVASVVVGFVAVCFVVVGCDEAPPPPVQPTTLTVWLDASEAELEFFKGVAAELAGRCGDVRLELTAQPFAALKPKFLGRPAGATEPDILYLVNDWVGELAGAGMLAALEPPDHAVLPQTLEGLTYRGRLYALPKSFGVVALVYNRDLIKKPPATFDEVAALAGRHDQAVRGDQAGRGEVWPLLYDNKNFFYHAPFFFGFGATLFDGEGRASVGSKAAIDSLKYVVQFETDRVVPPKANHAAAVNLFCAGKVGAILTGPWDTERIRASGVPAEVALLPDLPGGRRSRPFVGIHGFAVASGCRHPELARRAIDELTSVAVQRRALAELGRLSVATAVYEDLRKASGDGGVRHAQAAGQPSAGRSPAGRSPAVERDAQVFYEQARLGFPMPNGPEMTEVWQYMQWVLTRSFAEPGAVEDTVRQAVEAIDKRGQGTEGRVP